MDPHFSDFPDRMIASIVLKPTHTQFFILIVHASEHTGQNQVLRISH